MGDDDILSSSKIVRSTLQYTEIPGDTHPNGMVGTRESGVVQAIEIRYVICLLQVDYKHFEKRKKL